MLKYQTTYKQGYFKSSCKMEFKGKLYWCKEIFFKGANCWCDHYGLTGCWWLSSKPKETCLDPKKPHSHPFPLLLPNWSIPLITAGTFYLPPMAISVSCSTSKTNMFSPRFSWNQVPSPMKFPQEYQLTAGHKKAQRAKCSVVFATYAPFAPFKTSWTQGRQNCPQIFVVSS